MWVYAQYIVNTQPASSWNTRTHSVILSLALGLGYEQRCARDAAIAKPKLVLYNMAEQLLLQLLQRMADTTRRMSLANMYVVTSNSKHIVAMYSSLTSGTVTARTALMHDCEFAHTKLY